MSEEQQESPSQGLMFIYCNAAGETSERHLTRWQEIGHYIKGYSKGDKRVLTFRKDRVGEYLGGGEKLLKRADAPPPPKPARKDRPTDVLPEILFTGFAKVQRAVLEQQAANGGLQVVQSVTQRLAFLCGGPTAGPAKVERARERNVYILTEPNFFVLFETGELSDAVVDATRW